MDKLSTLFKGVTVCDDDYKNDIEGGYLVHLYNNDKEVGTVLLGTDNIHKIGDKYYIKNISSDEYEEIRNMIVSLTKNVE
jgi:hypothetical protein